jgi:hypothetical protein
MILQTSKEIEILQSLKLHFPALLLQIRKYCIPPCKLYSNKAINKLRYDSSHDE